jgi:sec-independent protein translocase protein TatA
MIGNLGFPEIMIILLILLLLFGAKRFPEIAGSLGTGIKEFKKNINDATREVDDSPPRYDNRLNPSDIDRTRASESEEKRPEPKRLI